MPRSSATVPEPPMAASGKFESVPDVRPNPGALSGAIYLPAAQLPDMPLVVVLHGCTQNGADYAASAGWLELADRHGFAVLIPQQQRSNNINLCFNWFEHGDTQRDMGEAASIKAMVDKVVDIYALDRSAIFITGLSAGAAMAGTMLACYPETFAGGGLIAGLPHGVAHSMSSAFQQMRSGPGENGAQLAANVTTATRHAGPWPRISIWHGTADQTVNAVNGEASVAQWLTVHGLQNEASQEERRGSLRRRTWYDTHGKPQVEHVSIAKMGHGTPIDPSGIDGVGQVAPFVLDFAIASSSHLIDFWGIGLESSQPRAERTADKPQNSIQVPRPHMPPEMAPLRFGKHHTDVGKIINDALRAAGLMR